jgi:hypothetical protein
MSYMRAFPLGLRRRDRNADDLSFQKSPKLGRKPKPPTLVTQNRNAVAAVSPSSLPLQNAAISSATNLLAAVNDISWSPAVSASDGPRPSLTLPQQNGRPRSRTAPSTPVIEPKLIAELPGSLLQENQGFPIGPQTVEPKDRLGVERNPSSVFLGFPTIPQLHQSPQEGTYSGHKRSASESHASHNHPSRGSRRVSTPPMTGKLPAEPHHTDLPMRRASSNGSPRDVKGTNTVFQKTSPSIRPAADAFTKDQNQEYAPLNVSQSS